MKKFDLDISGVDLFVEIPAYKEGTIFFENEEDVALMDTLLDIPNITEVCLDHARWAKVRFVAIPNRLEVIQLKEDVNGAINKAIIIAQEQLEDYQKELEDDHLSCM